MASLAEIRAKLLAQETKSNSGQSGGDNGIYPFWNIDIGKQATVRFLPDGDDKNTLFWVERLTIKLPFNGIKGEGETKQVKVSVPCVEMWNETCPILSEVRTWFKDKSLEEMGRKYWKKRSYVFQGFVVDDPLREENPPENPIRRFVIGPQIYQIIRSALLDPEMEQSPTDFVHGIDFRINKSNKGGFADYGASKWALRERPLSDDETAAIEKFGLFDLKEYLPKRPTEVELKVIREMFEASVDGEAFDGERWGQYYRPSSDATTGDPVTRNTTSKTTEKTTTNVDEDEPPFEVETKTSTKTTETKTDSNKAKDILSIIAARKSKA
jgi:hypothetical protein